MNDGPYRGKRAVDLALVLLFAPVALVIGGAAAALVGLTSRGPVLYRQDRVGLVGRDFEVVKFRTMIDDDNPVVADDSRITGIGRWLRRLSIDELPQLWNVVRGEMSFVGPRPTLRYQVDRYDEHQLRRLAVRPGLTGWAQINGRNSIEWSDRIELDIAYVERQSIGFDLAIVARTFGTLLSRSGVETHSIDDPVSRS